MLGAYKATRAGELYSCPFRFCSTSLLPDGALKGAGLTAHFVFFISFIFGLLVTVGSHMGFVVKSVGTVPLAVSQTPQPEYFL